MTACDLGVHGISEETEAADYAIVPAGKCCLPATEPLGSKRARVIRGNLIAVPIENSFLYVVVPVYLTAEGTDFPQLNRVIVISGDKVAMEPTLDAVIQSVFGTQQPQNPAQAPRGQPELSQARAQFDEAQKAMQQGDWGGFGKAMDVLKRVLNAPAQSVGQQ